MRPTHSEAEGGQTRYASQAKKEKLPKNKKLKQQTHYQWADS